MFNNNIDYKRIIIDEIALEGLEGIGIQFLWNRIEHRLSTTLTPKLKLRFWNFITSYENITFYEQPLDANYFQIKNRFKIIDEESGQMKNPDEYLDGPYEYKPVDKEYGSCQHYHTRVQISREDITKLSHEDIITKYGNKLVMVASLEERWYALAPHIPLSTLAILTPVHYCILELIGKSRENGQMTVGITNFTKITKDPKMLYYHRKRLQELDLITNVFVTHVVNNRGTKSILLRLKKFHKPSILTTPQEGRVHTIINYLIEMPNFKDSTTNLMKQNVLTNKMCKKIQKTVNIFKIEGMNNDSSQKPKPWQRRVISLVPESADESSHSEDESSECQNKCQYMLGINLPRQAYKMFLNAGNKGLTQVELSKLLGIEFYTSRTICRTFKQRNLIREFMEDRGRQRTSRYVATVATRDNDCKYAAEKRKFLDYLDNKQTEENNSSMNSPTEEHLHTNSDEIPSKQIKLENEENKSDNPQTDDDITEVTVLESSELQKSMNESLLGSVKGPTLRQLQFANGVIKVVREHISILGLQTLNQLVSKEIGQPLMDRKSLRRFLQKLLIDGQLRIYKLKWPGFQLKHSLLICAHHIKKNNPIVTSLYKDICVRAYIHKQKILQNDTSVSSETKLYRCTYPKFMKAQKLHEFLFHLVYNMENTGLTDLPRGFASVVNVIPEMPVELAVGHISTTKISEIQNIKKSDISSKKLRDSPQYVYDTVLRSKSFLSSLKTNFDVLATLGLIQVCFKTNLIFDYSSGFQKYIFFVNRRAKIVNTVGTWPREMPNCESLEKHYYLETIEDVNKYWDDVHDICTNTIVNRQRKEKKLPHIPVRNSKEVFEYDTGATFGDGLGAGGYHSSLYLEIPQLWRIHTILLCKNKSFAPKNQIKFRTNIKKNRQEKSIMKKKVKKPAQKKLVTRSNKAGKKLQEVTTTIKRRRHILWDKWEDEVIMMAKVAMTVMSPVIRPLSAHITNLVARDIISNLDRKKTTLQCFKRGVILEKKSTFVHEKQKLINELRRRHSRLTNYDGIITKLRIKYSTNINKYINESRIKCMELLWIVQQIYNSNAYNSAIPCVAYSLDEFYKNFNVSSPVLGKSVSLYATPPDSPLEVATIKEGIMQIINLGLISNINMDISMKIVDIFTTYLESHLRIAIDQLHKSGAISIRDKCSNVNTQKLLCSDIVQYSSVYKASASYQRRWSHRLNGSFVDNLISFLDSFPSSSKLKATSEICCLFCELLSSNIVNLVTTIKPTVGGSSMPEDTMSMDLDIKHYFKSGYIGWQKLNEVTKFADLYQNIDYQSAISSVICNATAHIVDDESIDDKLLSLLKGASENGKTFIELKDIMECNTEELRIKLHYFEEKHLIKRVGFRENKIVLSKFLKPWTLLIGDIRIIPSPWFELELKIGYFTFTNWCGTIMNKLFECPGYSVSALSTYFDCITCRSVQEICMFLEKCECVTLKTLHVTEPDLFSDDNIVMELSEFNEYAAPNFIIAFPTKDCIVKYANLKKCIEPYCVSY